MINYLKKNHLLLLIAALLAWMVLGFGSSIAIGATTARTTITNPWTFQQAVTFSSTISVSATSTEGSLGVPFYETKGGIDYAHVEVALTATSSVPGIIKNPFVSTAATSTILACGVEVTSNGIAVAQSLDISTTTGTGGYGSSTPAIMSGYAAGTGQFTAPCGFNSATSTQSATNAAGVKTGLLPGMTNAGLSNYISVTGEYLTARIASATPGTFTSYWTGTFWAWFMKP